MAWPLWKRDKGRTDDRGSGGLQSTSAAPALRAVGQDPRGPLTILRAVAWGRPGLKYGQGGALAWAEVRREEAKALKNRGQRAEA